MRERNSTNINTLLMRYKHADMLIAGGELLATRLLLLPAPLRLRAI